MELETFNRRSRPQVFRRMAREPFDILIIGGGITGASIFRDAVLRGMRVALIEAKDFASGASGRSSRLIHGGLRYLKSLNFRMVWEASHERNLHLRINKRLVQPLPFLIPLYRGKGESRTMMRLGMWIYEAMAGFKNHRFHSFLNREETLSLSPELPKDGLTGGCLYYDAAVNDNRLTVETIKDGVRNGGLAVNHTQASALIKENGKITGAICRDGTSGSTYEIQAGTVVNATGGFVDGIRKMDRPDVWNFVELSKGTHLVFDEKDVPLTITTVFSSPIDGQKLFIARREGCFLLGTSDNWEDAASDVPTPDHTDVDYLLESFRQFMPDADLSRDKIRYVYSGFRPLLLHHDKKVDPRSCSREDGIEIAPSGLISVVGGKLTTARRTAIRVLKHVINQLGGSNIWLPCRTHRLPICTDREDAEESHPRNRKDSPLRESLRNLYRQIGLDDHAIRLETLHIIRRAHSNPETELIHAELRYMCRREMVCTLEDLIDRRIGSLSWDNKKRLATLRRAGHIIREELDMSKEEFESQYHSYQVHLKRHHTLPE